jgi:hypothetical protein
LEKVTPMTPDPRSPGLAQLLATGIPADNAVVNPRVTNPLTSDVVDAWIRERAARDLVAPAPESER